MSAKRTVPSEADHPGTGSSQAAEPLTVEPQAAEPQAGEPLWKRDFPYESLAEDEVTRREFARFLVAGAGVMAAGNVGLAAWTQLRRINTGEPRALVPLDEVAVGETYLFAYPEDADPAILLRLSDTEVVAFSQKCTHLGCVVYFDADESRWHCPCHEGNFDAATGAVISGPPSRALGRIDLEVRDQVIWALGYQP
ncbi:MAG: ubiquinol-cytochrome c reductase iron-sulfur subunit [Actinobacteria bacterium]|nr:ubiquinol-cytochrome c reductase iron-sulfur subunit [Actinomycetota bacterium]MCB9388053.1 ubiquinol-cytochrome c reductase iron-sulfur subunit [Acidimicrobiia bacterium]